MCKPHVLRVLALVMVLSLLGHGLHASVASAATASKEATSAKGGRHGIRLARRVAAWLAVGAVGLYAAGVVALGGSTVYQYMKLPVAPHESLGTAFHSDRGFRTLRVDYVAPNGLLRDIGHVVQRQQGRGGYQFWRIYQRAQQHASAPPPSVDWQYVHFDPNLFTLDGLKHILRLQPLAVVASRTWTAPSPEVSEFWARSDPSQLVEAAEGLPSTRQQVVIVPMGARPSLSDDLPGLHQALRKAERELATRLGHGRPIHSIRRTGKQPIRQRIMPTPRRQRAYYASRR